MYLDTVSVAGIVLTLLIIAAFVALLLSRSKSDRERIHELQMRLDEGPTHELIPSEDARHLCCAIRRIYPSATVGLDFHVGDDGDGPYIREWLTPLPEPTDHQIQEALVLHHEEFAAGRYREKRKASYPSINDQLDALFWARQGDHTQLEEVDEHIRRVKIEYPKLGECEQ